MFAVVVTFTIKQSCWERFHPLIVENARLSLSREPGCLRFDICTERTRPGEMLLYELYDDASAFEHHLQTGHYRAFEAATAEMVESKRVATYGTIA